MSELSVIGLGDGAYYAPQIVADKLGFFQDEGLTVKYAGNGDPYGLGEAVSSGRADLSLGGMWRVLLYSNLGTRYRAFAQMNNQADLLVFGRTPRERFDWSALSVLLVTARGAPSPWFFLQEALRNRGADLGRLRVIPGLPIEEARQYFTLGFGDAIEISDLAGIPFLVDSEFSLIVNWREDLGTIPSSVYFSTPEWVRRRRSEAIALTRALGRAQEWLSSQALDGILDVVGSSFPTSVDPRGARAFTSNFREQEVWAGDPVIRREAFDHWVAVLTRCGLLSRPVAYESVVDTEVAAEAATGR